jgi:hypothetical protein
MHVSRVARAITPSKWEEAQSALHERVVRAADYDRKVSDMFSVSKTTDGCFPAFFFPFCSYGVSPFACSWWHRKAWPALPTHNMAYKRILRCSMFKHNFVMYSNYPKAHGG